MKIIWLTDLHLNFLEKPKRIKFYQSILNCNGDIIIITGDIAESDSICDLLKEMVTEIKLPVYFVLGNHDFYGGEVQKVRNEVIQQSKKEKLLFYLPSSDIVSLNAEVVLVGQDGWADGRYGDFKNSNVALNDSRLIDDFFQAKIISKFKLLEVMQQFADRDANQLKIDLELALSKLKPKQIIVSIHVPPFKEACLFQGLQSDDRFQPFFSSKVSGDVLLDVASKYKDVDFLVLCGHTHHKAEYQPLNNLKIKVGHAEYYNPQVCREINI